MKRQLMVPARAAPPTSATRQQQKIRMIKQTCSMFSKFMPAVENTWRPRRTDESYHEYRMRIVEKGDGDILRYAQIVNASLEGRTKLMLDLLRAHLEPDVQRQLAAFVASQDAPPMPPCIVAGAAWHVRRCTRCTAVHVRVHHVHELGLCDICECVNAENMEWAANMPCKELHKKKKKKKKKKRPIARAEEVEHQPTPEELLAALNAKKPRREEVETAGPFSWDEMTLREPVEGGFYLTS